MEKKYFVKLKREITPRDVVQFERGITLADGTKLRPAKLTAAESENSALVTITEGRFHQVKKMFLATGNEVIYLKRLSIGGLCLDGSLEPGEYKEITPEEAMTAYEQTDC